MRTKANIPKPQGNFVINTPEITYKKIWAILIKIEGPDTISAEVLLQFCSDFAPIFSDFAENFRTQRNHINTTYGRFLGQLKHFGPKMAIFSPFLAHFS